MKQYGKWILLLALAAGTGIAWMRGWIPGIGGSGPANTANGEAPAPLPDGGTGDAATPDRPQAPPGIPGDKLYELRKFAEAIPALQRELQGKSVTDVPRHYALIAYANEALRQMEAALPWWNRIGTEFPDSVYLADAECALGRRLPAGSEARRDHFARALDRAPDSPAVAQIAAELGESLEKAGRTWEARRAWTRVWAGLKPGDPRRADLENRLNALNQTLIFSPLPTPDSELYVVQAGDTLGKIAAKFNCPVGYMRRVNKLKGDNIVPGNRLKVLKGTWSARVDLGVCRLTLFLNGDFVKRYIVGIGKPETPTPQGTFTLTEKLIDPTWKGIPPGDPRNILGTRWLTFGEDPTYGIHGTAESADATVGAPSSNGCVRMHNGDVEEVFDLVPKGSKVTVVP